jgi:RluA family pseudouridine synthase
MVQARTDLSRRGAREAIKVGGVQVDRRRVRIAGRMPPPGAEIRVAVDDSLGEVPDFVPEALFEDDWLLVLYKPHGIPSQGTEASDRHDFMAAARRHFPQWTLYLVHRLDTGTSGAILLAKTQRAAGELGKMFRDHEVKKTYLAALQVPLAPCTAEAPVGRVPNSRPARFACVGDLIDVRPAATTFYPLDPAANPMELGPKNANWTVAEPLTGRTHQIRVHLAHLGRPVLGDVFYGGPPSDRLWLHAWKLELRHPMTGEALAVQADLSRKCVSDVQ